MTQKVVGSAVGTAGVGPGIEFCHTLGIEHVLLQCVRQ
jgi:hypothetical protein